MADAPVVDDGIARMQELAHTNHMAGEFCRCLCPKCFDPARIHPCVCAECRCEWSKAANA